MFAPESARAPDFSTFEFEEVLAFHEAGHAVAEYALGLGCPQISLTICISDDGEHQPRHLTACAGGNVLYGGAASSNKRTNRRVDRLMRRGIFGPEVLAYGIATAAGPAAERKFCLANGLPLNILAASGSDHEIIDSVAMQLEEFGGRNRFAYRRMVWRRAQLALENETIWQAVSVLADALICDPRELDDPGVHPQAMPGATARAIMRRHGVFPGILGFTA
jgi:hypothetical protein